MINNKKLNGFTIVETVTAIGIFCIIVTLAMTFYVNAAKIYIGSLSAREAEENVRNSLEVISRHIRDGRSVNSMAIGSTEGNISINSVDSNGTLYTVDIKKLCKAAPGRTDFDCNGANESRGYISINNSSSPGSTMKLTADTLNITEFKITPSAGTPLLFNITIKGQIEEALANGDSLEKGARGEGYVEMSTSVAMKGQYR
ncbi:MAG: hypothetical protein UT66_C0008G0011 [candidate division CPR2 bacterium GW2011_GWC1_39_9]|uniref:Type II secretion system protein n=1 Tax=candidate division CPR2 bacterium GW2011_GWC2_39_10 TaxID=1618345 RepID=A0A0G0M4D3_UNCC2|nr:MAG: hypothetical protein UT18_C0003G0024 [candidate division CPR2 bacterium GW2011_GWC2_39_10]KKR35669.1 MAG: hypothetical protein UT66_C0008G0011 [candidate division CPR2 bacterium GW2011_GWC1_39_9]